MYSKQGEKQIAFEEKYLIFGRQVHKVIASYYQSTRQTPSAETIRIQIDKAFERWYTPEIKTMFTRLTEIKKHFIKYELQRLKSWKQFYPTFVEKQLIVKPWHDLPEFRPIIDFYSEPAKTIIDWKTGTVDMNEDLMIQGKIYELALRSINKPVEHVIFFALKQGIAYEMPKIQDGWVYRICQETVELVKSGKFPKNPTILCNWCPFILKCEFDYCNLWDRI